MDLDRQLEIIINHGWSPLLLDCRTGWIGRVWLGIERPGHRVRIGQDGLLGRQKRMVWDELFVIVNRKPQDDWMVEDARKRDTRLVGTI